MSYSLSILESLYPVAALLFTFHLVGYLAGDHDRPRMTFRREWDGLIEGTPKG